MDKARFIETLHSDSRDYNDRKLLVNAILQRNEWVEILLEDIKEVDNKQSNLSIRILELACKVDLLLILPYLDEFCILLPTIKFDGVTRSSAKLIELLMIHYFIKKDATYLYELNNLHLEQFAESCFDWMIADRAIAIQAHSMYSLYLLGTKFNWIHTELKDNILRKLPITSSMGYQNRGKKIIDAILNTSEKLLTLY